MIILLSGMIASGKSGFSKLAASQGHIVMNNDSLLQLLHGGQYIYNPALKGFYQEVQNTIVKGAILEGRTVVIDRTNHTAKTRSRFIELAKSLNTPIICVVFPMEEPEVHAKRRFESDPRGYTLDRWIKVALQHDLEWEEPELSEGFDNVMGVELATHMLREGRL